MEKLLILSISLMLFSFPLLAQTDLAGKYDNNDNYFPKSLTLTAENRFVQTSGVLEGHGSNISKGYYWVVTDTLLLFYDSIVPEYPPSRFTITNQSQSIFYEQGGRKMNKDAASVDITIQDHNGRLLPGCNVFFMTADDNMVFGQVSQQSGRIAHGVNRGEGIDHIIISFIGYGAVNIDMKDLWGSVSNITVVLEKESNNSYNQQHKIEKYFINKSNKGEYSFQNIKQGQCCKFTKKKQSG